MAEAILQETFKGEFNWIFFWENPIKLTPKTP